MKKNRIKSKEKIDSGSGCKINFIDYAMFTRSIPKEILITFDTNNHSLSF